MVHLLRATCSIYIDDFKGDFNDLDVPAGDGAVSQDDGEADYGFDLSRSQVPFTVPVPFIWFPA